MLAARQSPSRCSSRHPIRFLKFLRGFAALHDGTMFEQHSASRLCFSFGDLGGERAVARWRTSAGSPSNGRRIYEMAPASPVSPRERRARQTIRWRRERRRHDLRALARQFKRLRWSPTLVELLLEELYVTDELSALLAPVGDLSPGRYPQLVAVALALRHSWRPDDLREIAKRLGVTSKT